MLTQIAIAAFGLVALWLAMGRDERLRRWAPIVGLLGQPAWAWFGWQAEAWGLLAVALAYTGVYAHGAWAQWR